MAVKITAAILIIFLPIVLLLGYAFSIPAQYTNTFVGELDDKFERLTSIDEPKLVVVGGSSVAFGLESEILEKYVGMPVVNFGLYAALGTKVMLDLSKAGINEGDVVVLAPELDALREKIKPYIEQDEDVLSYALFEQVALKFFEYRKAKKYGIDADNADSALGVHTV